MNEPARLLAGEALARYYADHGLGADGGIAVTHWAPLRWLGLRLRNFDWRRRAIQRHDLHHLLTGYPCTAEGEFQVAAWEFAAGRFPSAGATLFCLPLVGIGAVLAPKKSLRAFVCGRHSASLYRVASMEPLLDMDLAQLRARVLPPVQPRTGLRDIVAFYSLAALSMAWIACPAALLCLLFMALS